MKIDLLTQPSQEEFRNLAQQHSVLPVWMELLADLTTPVSLFARCVGNGPGFLLESVERGENWSRWSFIGRNPILTISCIEGAARVEGEFSSDFLKEGPFLEVLEKLLDYYRSPTLQGLPPLYSGLMGYMGYDVVREIEDIGESALDDRGFPDGIMSLIGELVAIDHWKQRAVLVANVVIPRDANIETLDQIYLDAVNRLKKLAIDGGQPLDEPLMQPPNVEDESLKITSSMDKKEYIAAVEKAQERIFDGDIFQVVLSQRFDVELEADSFDVYRVLRQLNPSPYMYYLRYDEFTIVGASPESLVKVLDGSVISRPIAGTRRRGYDEADEREMEIELIEDPKEIAEHVMLLDLARNDIGRVVRFGTEQVTELMMLERYSHVMHLTSEVSGILDEGFTSIDVLKATFPAGTVSGAPKVQAMKIIDELEPLKRGPYAGVVGYLDFSGNLDTAITIRTMLVKDGIASIQAGAGIVADSIPELEHEECLNKAKALLCAIPAARKMTNERRNSR